MRTEITQQSICLSYKGNNDAPIEYIFQEEQALAFFLSKEIIFINTNWYEDTWPEKAKKMPVLYVNCNDIFVLAADAECIYSDELDTLWQYYTKDQTWGPIMWCITKAKLMPQKHIYDSIQEQGIWDIDKIKGLQFNPTWQKNDKP